MNYETIEKLFEGKFSSRHSKNLFRFILVVLYGGGIFFLLWNGWRNRDYIRPLLENAEYFYITYAILWYVLCLLVSILLWLLVIKTFSSQANWWKNIQIYAITFSARRLPGTIWYVGGRMLLYQNIGISKSVVLSASLLEFIVGYVAAGIVGLSFLFVAIRKSSFLFSVIILGLITGGMILFFSNLFRKLTKSIRAVPQIRATIIDWLSWIISALAMWILSGLMVTQFIKILQPDLNTKNMFFIIGAWAMSGLAGLLTYFLPSSFGATEFSLTLLLSQILPLPLAGAVAITVRIFTLVMDILLSVFFLPFLIRESMFLTMAHDRDNAAIINNPDNSDSKKDSLK